MATISPKSKFVELIDPRNDKLSKEHISVLDE